MTKYFFDYIGYNLFLKTLVNSTYILIEKKKKMWNLSRRQPPLTHVVKYNTPTRTFAQLKTDLFQVIVPHLISRHVGWTYAFFFFYKNIK